MQLAHSQEAEHQTSIWLPMTTGSGGIQYVQSNENQPRIRDTLGELQNLIHN